MNFTGISWAREGVQNKKSSGGGGGSMDIFWNHTFERDGGRGNHVFFRDN